MSGMKQSGRWQLVRIVVGVALGAALLVAWPAIGLAQSVVIYEDPNFGGRSQTLGVGQHRLSDFNAIASSIKVPAGLVALLYDHADSGGGYGVSVDLLEDHPDLAQLSFDNKASYVTVFGTKNPAGFVWARNSMQNGQFVPGHWERQRAGGSPANTTAVLSPPLPPHAPGAQPPPDVAGPVVRDHRARGTPASVLETTFKNPPFDTSKESWARDVVHGKTMFPDFYDVDIIPGTRIFSSPDYSKNEWTQILSPGEDYDLDVVGVSGRAILLGNGQSGNDVPFTHPFGKDWEFYIAPDAAYQSLAAAPAPPPNTHPEYAQSVVLAKNDFGLVVVNTLGVEWDQDLIPAAYRPVHGDRVAVWGRWIVDTGHPDFHTEIHPPLLLVTGRATSTDETTTTVIGRAYLVSQTWPGGLGMIDHLLEEADKIPTRSVRAEAHPAIMPKAFTGTYLMIYTVRAPSARTSPLDQLMVSFHFTVRTGVVVQVANSGDAVTVAIAMNGNTNKRAPLPTRHDWTVTRQELKAADSRAGDLYLGKEIERGGLSLGIGAALLARGVLSDRYDAPVPRSAHDHEMTRVPVKSLSGNTPFSVDDGQPFPIYGTLILSWQRGAAVR